MSRMGRDTFSIFPPPESAPSEAAPSGRPADTGSNSSVVNYRCPITDLPCQLHPFSALVKCGHVFSQRAIDQVCGPLSSCPIIGKNPLEQAFTGLASSSFCQQSPIKTRKPTSTGLYDKRSRAMLEMKGLGISESYLISTYPNLPRHCAIHQGVAY